MAHSRQARKRWRQNERRRARNRPIRTEVRTSVRGARTAITDGGDGPAAIREAVAILDRAAKRRAIHPNAASRHKSRMMRLANKAGAPVAEAPKKGRKTTAKSSTKTAAKKAPAKPRATRAKKSES